MRILKKCTHIWN